MSIVPDTKDWTWVLARRCPECGLDVRSVDRGRIGAMIRTNAAAWVATRHRTDETWWQRRPDPQTWSPLEYACHVRDVHRIFAARLAVILTEDDPLWPDWDQNAAAIDRDYGAQSIDAVLSDLVKRAERIAAGYDILDDPQWQRPGRRSDRAHFTAESLARYHLHDVVHHLADIGGDTTSAT